MDSNITKNTFLYKFLKVDCSDNKLGIKKVLHQQFLQAIDLYRQRNQIRDSWESIIVSIPDKIILCNINSPKNLIERKFSGSSLLNYQTYRCAIAFPLANCCGIKPVDMARELVSCFPEVSLEQVTNSHIKIMIKIIPPGWIDFTINLHYLSIWLQELILKLKVIHDDKRKTQTCYKNLQLMIKTPDLFSINYYYSRCCSLLKLGEREKLIKLDNHNFETLSWKISNPNLIFWLDDAENFLLTHPQELNLLHFLLLTLDTFSDLSDNQTDEVKTKIWIDCGLALSQALEQFLIACRFCGEIKHNNRSLAVARLGLIALVQWCLFNLLWRKLQITPILLTEI